MLVYVSHDSKWGFRPPTKFGLVKPTLGWYVTTLSPKEVSDLWADLGLVGSDVFVTHLSFWNKEASEASYGGMTHDVWMALVDGVLPSWEGVLILGN